MIVCFGLVEVFRVTCPNLHGHQKVTLGLLGYPWFCWLLASLYNYTGSGGGISEENLIFLSFSRHAMKYKCGLCKELLTRCCKIWISPVPSINTPHWRGYLTFCSGVKFLHGVESTAVNPESIGQLPRLLPIFYGKKASRRATSGNGVLEEEAKAVAKSAETNRTKASMVSAPPGSLLGPSNTAQSFLADIENKLALILSEWKLHTSKIASNFALWHTAVS